MIQSVFPVLLVSFPRTNPLGIQIGFLMKSETKTLQLSQTKALSWPSFVMKLWPDFDYNSLLIWQWYVGGENPVPHTFNCVSLSTNCCSESLKHHRLFCSTVHARLVVCSWCMCVLGVIQRVVRVFFLRNPSPPRCRAQNLPIPGGSNGSVWAGQTQELPPAVRSSGTVQL